MSSPMSEGYLDIKSSVETVSSYWLFNHSMKNNLNRADILVRMLAIDNFYKKNANGFKLYNIMQQARCAQNNKIPQCQANNQEAFIQLIKSFENGFDINYPIIVNRNFELLDGSHRLALSLYKHIKDIPILRWDTVFTVNYSLNWFKENGLAYFEPYILQKYKSVLLEYGR